MIKYSQRTYSPFHRDTSCDPEQKEPSWYEEYRKTVEKHSTQSQKSIYEQIAAILGDSKSKYSSVEEAVEDMKERTGLKQFIDKQASLNITEPEIFKTIPEMKIFIDNFVDDRPGTSIEAVVHDLLKLDTIKNKLPDKTDVSPDVKAYINAKLAESKYLNSDANEVNMNIGKVEDDKNMSVDDPLGFTQPSS